MLAIAAPAVPILAVVRRGGVVALPLPVFVGRRSMHDLWRLYRGHPEAAPAQRLEVLAGSRAYLVPRRLR